MPGGSRSRVRDGGLQESREARNSMSKWFLVYASLFMLFWAWPFAHFAEEKDGDGDSTFSHVIQVGDATVVSLQVSAWWLQYAHTLAC